MISIIKFIHLLSTIGLLGTAVCSLLLSARKFVQHDVNHHEILIRLNKSMLVLAFFAMLTGTFLVYPKHFTFHTPWIQAAYFLVTVFSLGIGALMIMIKKNPLRSRGFWCGAYLFLMIILICVIHDAVTKTTFF